MFVPKPVADVPNSPFPVLDRPAAVPRWSRYRAKLSRSASFTSHICPGSAFICPGSGSACPASGGRQLPDIRLGGRDAHSGASEADVASPGTPEPCQYTPSVGRPLTPAPIRARPCTTSSIAPVQRVIEPRKVSDYLVISLLNGAAFPAGIRRFPADRFRLPVPGLEFPVFIHREFGRKATGFQEVTATESALPGPKKTKIPCSSL